MDAEARLRKALDLNRRLPSSYVEENLAGMIDLAPDLVEELLSLIDQPLRVVDDPQVGLPFIACDYNRDLDSFRSPYTSIYYPPLPDGMQPSERIRNIEIVMNEAFETYKSLYYGSGALSSVYLWDTEVGFSACVLIKKTGDTNAKHPIDGGWESVNIIEVIETENPITYCVTTTIMLTMKSDDPDVGTTELSGSLVRQKTFKINYREKEDDYQHIVNIGKCVEEMEGLLRSRLNSIYFGQTFGALDEIRAENGLGTLLEKLNNQSSVINEMRE